MLVEVAETGSLHKAAASMGISQPAISHVLADLEAMLETPLFLRHARGMRPTALGQQALRSARRILAEIDDVALQTVALRGGTKGVVRMASIGGGITGFLAPALAAFAREQPHVLLHLQEADPTRLPALVAAGEVDLAVWRETGPVPAGWAFRPLIADRFVVVAGPQHPLARAAKVSMDQLRRQTWFGAPIDSAALEVADRLFGIDQPLHPAFQVECRVPEILLAMLRSTRQVTLIPFSVARQFIESGLLVELPLDRVVPFLPLGLLEPLEVHAEAAAAVSAFLIRYATAWQDPDVPAPERAGRSRVASKKGASKS